MMRDVDKKETAMDPGAAREAAGRILDGLGEIDDDMILDADPIRLAALRDSGEFREAEEGDGSAASAAVGAADAASVSKAAGTASSKSGRQGKSGRSGLAGFASAKAMRVLAACLCVALGIGFALRGGIPRMGSSKNVQFSNDAPAPMAAEAPAMADQMQAEPAETAEAEDDLVQESKVSAVNTPAEAAADNDSREAPDTEAANGALSVEKPTESPAQEIQLTAAYLTADGADSKLKTDLGFGQLDTDLVNFIDAEGFRQENYMLSPASFRAALALAVSGAEGETKQQLLNASGFDSVEEMNSWYASLNGSIKLFAERLEADKQDFERNKQYMSPDAKGPDGAFEIANSVWHNSDKPGKMKDSYKSYVADSYSAEAQEADSVSITEKVNGWCDEKTHGMIPVIADDLSEEASVLVNALYLRTSWLTRFDEGFTQPGDFTCMDGSVVQKDFMKQKQKLAYYEDGETQLVVMPMNGDIRAVFVLGSTEGLTGKMDQAEYCDVIVKLPKFEVETSFEHQEFVEFLAARGADLPFRQDGTADFSAMCEGADWFISDIIQKSKIKLDEDGIEAAAVTAIMVRATSAMPRPEEPKEFTADRPFSFALITSSEEPELLFYGQVVK